MTTHSDEPLPDEPSADERPPDATRVGAHLVVDETDWVPGDHPEPHRRSGGSWYPESYFRCVRCGAERLRTDDFPDDCPPAT